MELGTAEEFLATVNHPDLWHPRRSFNLIFEGMVLPHLRLMYDTLMPHVIPGETVVVGSILAMAARCAHEKWHFPFTSVHLQPSVFRSVGDPPQLAGIPNMQGWPPWLIHGMNRLADVFIDSKLAGPLNAFRTSLGLSPVRRILDQWWHSPQCVIGFFPEWFAAPQPDWPAHTRLVGFPLYDASSVEAPPPDLDVFLESGPPPIVFTPGSANSQGAAFFQASAETCKTLGCRGLFLTRFPEQVPLDLPPTIRRFGYVPFSKVLPRAAALVHHGGIGTTAQAFAAGIPQLVTPLAHDQLDNAARIRRLGVGLPVAPRLYAKTGGRDLLRRLLGESSFNSAAQKIRQTFAGENSVEAASGILEQL